MKYTITIEEAVTKDFKIEASSTDDAYKMAEQKYKSGELILDPGECQFRQITITKPSDERNEWREFQPLLSIIHNERYRHINNKYNIINFIDDIIEYIYKKI